MRSNVAANANGIWRITRCIVALATCAAFSGCKESAKPPAAPPPPQVSVIELKPGAVTVYDEYVAQTQAPSTIEIRSQVTGLLDRQAFADGGRVKKNDLRYIIDQRPFQASLAQAKANLVNAQQNLARQRAPLEATKAAIADVGRHRGRFCASMTQSCATALASPWHYLIDPVLAAASPRAREHR
jgi:multidrug efflux pump subunit AcrA (membrane-fusion protein)